jgi:hypothetical protein
MANILSLFKKNIFLSVSLLLFIILGLGLSFVEIVAMKEYKPSYILGINKSDNSEEEVVLLEEESTESTTQNENENSTREEEETNADEEDDSIQIQPSEKQTEKQQDSNGNETCYQHNNAFSVEVPADWTCSSPADENRTQGDSVEYELQVLRLKHNQDPLEIEFSKGPGIGITGATEETYYENELYKVTKFTFDSGVSYIGSAKSDSTKTEPEYPKIMIYSTNEDTDEEALINKHDREIKQIIDSYTQL